MKSWKVIVAALFYLHLAFGPVWAQVLTVSEGNINRVIGHGVHSRSCSYNNSPGSSSNFDHLEWQLNGSLFSEDATFVDNDIQLEDMGQYRCVARDTSNGIIAVADAGSLAVFDPAVAISAPTRQEFLVNEDAELQCETTVIPNTNILLTRTSGGGQVTNNRLYNVTLEDGGQYSCQIFDSLSLGTLLFETTIEVLIIVPPTILSETTVEDTYSNEPANFTVSYYSTFRSDVTVKWLRNNVFFTPDEEQRMIRTEYINDTVGSTTLTFPQLSRADQAQYSVQITNQRSVIPSGRRATSATFLVRVFVPPTPPSQPQFTKLNSTLTRVTWNLTNSTADAGPEFLTVTVTDHPDSPIRLEPNTEELLLTTEPGNNYVVTVMASNIDGRVSSQSAHLILGPEPPSVVRSSLVRLNVTTFNFSLEVLFTGTGSAGTLSLTDIMFRENGTDSGSWLLFTSDVMLTATEPQGRHLYALISDIRFEMLTDVEFSLTLQNDMNMNVRISGIQEIVLPGPPQDLTLVSATENSLTVRARLSAVGTAPILSAHLTLTPSTNMVTVTEDLTPGGLVTFEAWDLSPDTSYTVVCFARNNAGRGLDSRKEVFRTAAVASVLPLWIILIIAVVGSLVVVVLLSLLVIARCCRRGRGARKINLASSALPSQHSRPGPLGSDSIESINTASNYAHSQKSAQGFVLGPTPLGTGSRPSPLAPRYVNHDINRQYSFSKPPLNSSSSDCSNPSPQPFHHFNFCHSPMPPSELEHSYYKFSRSMPVLEDPDLSPKMPPNCATDV